LRRAATTSGEWRDSRVEISATARASGFSDSTSAEVVARSRSASETCESVGVASHEPGQRHQPGTFATGELVWSAVCQHERADPLPTGVRDLEHLHEMKPSLRGDRDSATTRCQGRPSEPACERGVDRDHRHRALGVEPCGHGDRDLGDDDRKLDDAVQGTRSEVVRQRSRLATSSSTTTVVANHP
jgi:hypothetical protein